MKPLEHRFFPRGGFSSSQWNHIEETNDVNFIAHQNRSRRGHQRFGCGLSA